MKKLAGIRQRNAPKAPTIAMRPEESRNMILNRLISGDGIKRRKLCNVIL